jgi:hypothetical protein
MTPIVDKPRVGVMASDTAIWTHCNVTKHTIDESTNLRVTQPTVPYKVFECACCSDQNSKPCGLDCCIGGASGVGTARLSCSLVPDHHGVLQKRLGFFANHSKG